MQYLNFKVNEIFHNFIILTLTCLAHLLERVKETSLYAQNHEKVHVKTEPEIQTTRNLLN